ncbi:hypothetical protein [Intestinirhabdus alba]|jgi:hypothetical protein|uniref:Uncharacterized protein n=1 Tax=Intestinirhabdus alba TaxID=2899544 RepID=A0A6L6ILX2_9ENTR|nr:hypothetical protein [Intestinirhabdus alba]MTH46954.1 hypothetical protein [Intestinirhabdus alba]
MTEPLNQPAYRHGFIHRHSEPAEQPQSTRLLAIERGQAGHTYWPTEKRSVNVDEGHRLRCLPPRSAKKGASAE